MHTHQQRLSMYDDSGMGLFAIKIYFKLTFCEFDKQQTLSKAAKTLALFAIKF